jgi:protocatechuate 3,4-dioxygenase beta subunit
MKTAAAILLLAAASGAQAPRQAVVRGHVTAREDARPLRNALLTLASGFPAGERYAVTDTRGVYEFRDVAPGRYDLWCSKAGYLSARVAAAGLRVGREDRESVDFRLLRSAAISGRVRDEDGEPLAGVTVSVTADSYGQGRRARPLQAQARTSQDGRYRLFGLPPGRYWVMAHFERTAFGYTPLFYFNTIAPADARPVDLAAGGDVDGVDFHMRRAMRLARLAGRVVDERMRPAEGGAVTATLADLDLGQLAVATIQRDGRFEIAGLVPGRYVLTLNVPRQNTILREVYVGGESNFVTIWMSPGATVRGRIAFAGDPASLRDRFLDLTAWTSRLGLIARDQTFEIRDVQPGRYRVDVRARRGVGDTGLTDGNDPFYVATVLAGQSDVTESGLSVSERQSAANLEVILGGDGGTVKGELRDQAGQPLADSFVVLAPADIRLRYSARHFKSVATDSNGRFIVRGIIPGTYLLFPWPYGGVYSLLRPELFARLQPFAAKVVVEKESEVTQNLEVSKAFRAVVDAWIP